jgi:hypothetical protein
VSEHERERGLARGEVVARCSFQDETNWGNVGLRRRGEISDPFYSDCKAPHPPTPPRHAGEPPLSRRLRGGRLLTAASTALACRQVGTKEHPRGVTAPRFDVDKR